MEPSRVKKLGVRGLLWWLSLLCFFVTLFFLVPDLDDMWQPLDLEEKHEASSKFVITPPAEKHEMNPFARPFLFQLAGNDKVNSLERERNVKLRYRTILQQLKAGEVPKVEVRSDPSMTLLTIDEQPFLNVLPEDCPDYYGRLSEEDKRLLESEVAYLWRELIAEDLAWRVFQRQDAYQSLFNYIAASLFFLVVLIHLSIDLFSRRFLKHPAWSLKAVLWLSYFWIFTSMHPSIENVANFLSQGALRPLSMFIGVAVMVDVCQRFTVLFIHWYYRILGELNGNRDTLREKQRRLTVKQAAIFTIRALWATAGMAIYLYLLGVDLSSFFAGAGLIGVAIGVLARDILLDIFYGINIISEDQFGVGDWIESNQDSGEVVAFTLRATQIRKVDGSLMTVPNSDLRRVKNHSNEWSQVDYSVVVAYNTDTDAALQLMQQEAELLMAEFPEQILEAPKPLGVHQLDLDGVTLRMLIKTAPLAQWRIRRALNRRVKLRFEVEGIDFAAGRRRVHLISEEPKPALAINFPESPTQSPEDL